MAQFIIANCKSIQAVLLLFSIATAGLAILPAPSSQATAAPAALHGEASAAVECFELASRSGTPPARAAGVCADALKDRTLDARTREATLVNRALILRRQGHVEEAASDCGKAITYGLESAASAVTCAAVLINAGKPEAAITLLEKSPLPTAKERHKYYHNLALAHHDLGQYETALGFIEKTIGANPHFAPAYELKQQYRVDRSPIAK